MLSTAMTLLLLACLVGCGVCCVLAGITEGDR